MLDLLRASNEEAGDVVISEILPAVVKEYGECIVGEGMAILAGEIVGAICPRVNNIRLGYKQNRLERNVNRIFFHLSMRQEELETRLLQLESNEKTYQYLIKLSEMLLDQIVEEIQEKKVDYNVNGYINLVKSENANEDMALMFFKTLAQLNDLDLRVLGLYSLTSEETAYDIVAELKISYEQLKCIKEKLERFGLLQSKNEEISDDNLEQVVKYLQDVEKERKKSRPRDIKLPRLKKISSTDTYRITSLGREYLQLIKE